MTATAMLFSTEANTPVDWRKNSIVSVEKLVGISGFGYTNTSFGRLKAERKMR